MRILWHHLPARLVTGAYIVHSGLGKLHAGEETAAQYHGMASGAYPQFQRLSPGQFTRLLGASEVALGTALLLPVVPSALAGGGLAAFAGGLLGLYARIPGMRQPGSIWPTQQGMALSKDSWMFGIGVSMLLADLLDRRAQRS